jgi:hypothetical protein
VGLYEQCIGIRAVDLFQVPDMLGRLERPAFSRCLPLQYLQETAVPAQRGGHIAIGDPLIIGGHVELHLVDHRGEVVGGDGNTFLRALGAHGVHGLEFRNQPVYPVQVCLDPGDAWVAAVGSRFRWRQGIGRLPGQGDPVVRIHRQQVMKDRGAGARSPDHENGALDGLLGDLGVLPEQVDQAQAVFQGAQ